MGTQLQTLINLCEEEKGRLPLLIQRCLKEEEYLLAHYHSNALYQLNTQIFTLHSMDDPLYGEKHYR